MEEVPFPRNVLDKMIFKSNQIKDLVGVTTMHCGPATPSASASIMRWMIGSRNAAVLPEPV